MFDTMTRVVKTKDPAIQMPPKSPLASDDKWSREKKTRNTIKVLYQKA